jgi:hypothetical protein
MLGFGAGLLMYLILPLRALAHPPVNWGNPVSLSRLWWLVSGQLYQSYYLQTSLSENWEHLRAWAALLLQQFGAFGLVLGLIGLIIAGRPSRLHIFTAWTAVVSIAFAVFYGSSDFYVYLIPMFIVFAIWIGLGLAGLACSFSRRFPQAGLLLGLLLVSYFAGRSVVQFSRVDASDDLRAEYFGREVLSLAPEDAIIFAQGDRAIFALWYFHFALGERPDLSVIATDLLHFDWYQEVLQTSYPLLALPRPFPYPETISIANPVRTICTVQFTNETEIECSEPAPIP